MAQAIALMYTIRPKEIDRCRPPNLLRTRDDVKLTVPKRRKAFNWGKSVIESIPLTSAAVSGLFTKAPHERCVPAGIDISTGVLRRWSKALFWMVFRCVSMEKDWRHNSRSSWVSVAKQKIGPSCQSWPPTAISSDSLDDLGMMQTSSSGDSVAVEPVTGPVVAGEMGTMRETTEGEPQRQRPLVALSRSEPQAEDAAAPGDVEWAGGELVSGSLGLSGPLSCLPYLSDSSETKNQMINRNKKVIKTL